MTSYAPSIFSIYKCQEEVCPSHKPGCSTDWDSVLLETYLWTFDFDRHPNAFIFINEREGEGYFSDQHTWNIQCQLENGDQPFPAVILDEMERVIKSDDADAISSFMGRLCDRFRTYCYALHDMAYEWLEYPEIPGEEIHDIIEGVVYHNAFILQESILTARTNILCLTPADNNKVYEILSAAIRNLKYYESKYITTEFYAFEAHVPSLRATMRRWNSTFKGKVEDNFVPFDLIF